MVMLSSNPHRTAVGDPGEDEAAADERHEPSADSLPGRIGREPRQGRTRGHEDPGGDPHLPIQRHHLPPTDDRQPGVDAGSRTPLDADDALEARGHQFLTGFLAAIARLADHVHRVLASDGTDRFRVEPIEGNVAGEVDMHLAELSRRADVDEGQLLAAAAEIGEHRGGNRGDHGSTSWGSGETGQNQNAIGMSTPFDMFMLSKP